MMMIACKVHVREVQAMPPKRIIGGHFAPPALLLSAAKTDFQVVQKWTLMHDLFSPRGFFAACSTRTLLNIIGGKK